MSTNLPEPTVKWVYLSWQGRLSRHSYFLGAALIVITQIIIGLSLIDADNNNNTIMTAWGLLLIAFWLASAWAVLAMTIKRLNDMDKPRLWAVCLFIPMGSMLFILFMMIAPGSQKTNAHGPPPFPKK